MPKLEDFTGRVFGRWTVLKRVANKTFKSCPSGTVQYLCRCECGNEKKVGARSLKTGISKSCGCLRKELARERALKDLTGRRFYRLEVVKIVKNSPHHKISSGHVQYLCKCDCGREKTIKSRELLHGDAKSCGCLTNEILKARSGEKNPAWRGGRRTTPKGYVLLSAFDHPNASKSGRVMEHRVVMSEMLGRPLHDDEFVHHKNGVKDDNRPENLELRVGAHAQGISVEDAVAWAEEILERYDSSARSDTG